MKNTTTIYDRVSKEKRELVTLTESAACFRFIKEMNGCLTAIRSQMNQRDVSSDSPTTASDLFESYFRDLEHLSEATDFAHQEYGQSYENTKHFLKKRMERILLDEELSEAVFGKPMNLGKEDVLKITQVYPEIFHREDYVFNNDFRNVDTFIDSFHRFLQNYLIGGEDYLQTVLNDDHREGENPTLDNELLPALILSYNPYSPEPIEIVIGKLVTLHILLDYVSEQTMYCLNLVDESLDYEQTEEFLQSLANPNYRAGYAYPINPFDEMSLKTSYLNEKLQQAFGNGLAYYIGAHKAEILELCDGIDEIQLRSRMLQFSKNTLNDLIKIDRIEGDTPENCFNSFRAVLLDYFAGKLEE